MGDNIWRLRAYYPLIRDLSNTRPAAANALHPDPTLMDFFGHYQDKPNQWLDPMEFKLLIETTTEAKRLNLPRERCNEDRYS